MPQVTQVTNPQLIEQNCKNSIRPTLTAVAVVMKCRYAKYRNTPYFILAGFFDEKRARTSTRCTHLLYCIMVLVIVRNGDNIGTQRGQLQPNLCVVWIGHDRAKFSFEFER